MVDQSMAMVKPQQNGYPRGLVSTASLLERPWAKASEKYSSVDIKSFPIDGNQPVSTMTRQLLVGGLNPSEKYEFVNWDDGYSQY